MEAPPPSSDEHKEYEYEYESASSAVDRMPPGFRFHPTDSEIIIHYLLNKLIHPRFRSVAIADNIDLNKCEPWDLPQKAGKMVGEKEWFFFFEKEAKYPSGTRTNRATASGYWKATGRDKEILIHRRGGNMGIVVGMKKTLVFYKGRAPKGDKTNWVLHEYRLHGDFSAYKQISNSAKAKWVVCRVSHNKNATTARDHVELSRIDSFVDSPTPLTDYSSLSRKPSSAPAPQETYQIIPITTSSSTLMTSNSNIMLQEFQQHHQNYNFLLDPYLNYSSTTNPNYSSHNMNSSTLPYESPSLAYQDGLSSSMTEWYLTNFPIKGGETDDDKSNEAGHVYIGGKETERVCKMEATSFDSSPSQDTGLSTEMVAAAVAHEINWEKERESKKADDAVAESDLCFSPNISEMDSLWSY